MASGETILLGCRSLPVLAVHDAVGVTKTPPTPLLQTCWDWVFKINVERMNGTAIRGREK